MLLERRATSSSHDFSGRAVLNDINLDIHAGEVLGIAGVEGNGQTELVEAIVGMRQPTTGVVELGDEDISDWATRRAARPASATSPRTGTATGCCSTPRCGRTASSATRPGRRRVQGRLAQPRAVPASDAERIVEEYDVRTPGIDTTARALSGGNQQKFIVGREMSGDPVAADRLAPDPRRRRRRPGADLGPHQAGPHERAWRCC